MPQFLAESEKYKVTSEWEAVTLHFKNSFKSSVFIGDFYGDVDSAIITRNEKFVVMGGCGIIIYRLEKPFESYEYGKITGQFKEFYRSEPNLWWVSGIHQNEIDQDLNIFRFIVEKNEGTFVYKMNAESLAITQIS